MHRFIRRSLPGLALLIGVASSVGWAPLPWNSSEVVAITEKLSTTLRELLADPGLRAQQTTAYEQRHHEVAIAVVKQVQPRVAELRKRVVSSQDREVSRPYFERVAELREEIAIYAEQSSLPDATREKANRARALFDQLARFYD